MFDTWLYKYMTIDSQENNVHEVGKCVGERCVQWQGIPREGTNNMYLHEYMLVNSKTYCDFAGYLFVYTNLNLLYAQY